LSIFSDYEIELLVQNVVEPVFYENQEKVKIQLDKSFVAHLIVASEMTIVHWVKTVTEQI